jgi:hypothetical protein
LHQARIKAIPYPNAEVSEVLSQKVYEVWWGGKVTPGRPEVVGGGVIVPQKHSMIVDSEDPDCIASEKKSFLRFDLGDRSKS